MDDTESGFLAQLQQIDAYEFEHFVAKLWELQNWDTHVTGGSDDGGIDVIAERSTPVSEKQVIQVKRYDSSNSVGRPDIQQYSSIRQERTDVDTVVIVTSGRFTDEAEDVAKDLNVKLIDGQKLNNLIVALNAGQLARSYIDPDVDRGGATQNDPEDGRNTAHLQDSEEMGGAQSITEIGEGTQLTDVPRHLPDLIKLRGEIVEQLEGLKSEVESAEKAFQHERYFDAVEGYEKVNKRRTELQREIARYDAALLHTNRDTAEHLPTTERFTTDLARITEGVNKHFEEAFQIAERAKGLELLVIEISDRIKSIKACIEKGDQLRQNANLERAHSKYKQAEHDLDAVRETMEIYQGLVSTSDDAVIDSYPEIPQNLSLSELESEIDSRIDSKGELPASQKLAEEAIGSVDASLLTENSGELFDKDLIEYLVEDERLEFIFVPPRMGFKIAASGGVEATAQHKASQSGSSFLLVTDQRILYVAGVNDHDETQNIPYEQITGITTSTDATSRHLKFTRHDGTEYRFDGLRDNISDLERAASYISDQLE